MRKRRRSVVESVIKDSKSWEPDRELPLWPNGNDLVSCSACQVC